MSFRPFLLELFMFVKVENTCYIIAEFRIGHYERSNSIELVVLLENRCRLMLSGFLPFDIFTEMGLQEYFDTKVHIYFKIWVNPISD